MKTSTDTNLGQYLLDTDCCDPYTNAELTITLRLAFSQINPANNALSGKGVDGEGKSHKIMKWGDRQWEYWLKSFVRTCRQYWNDRFWLISNFSALDFKHGSDTYRPNVACKFDVIPVSQSSGTFHKVINIVKLDPTDSKYFRSSAVLYSNRDMDPVVKDFASDGKGILQSTHYHEVGHLLGLSHVDVGKPHCLAGSDLNARPCYGIADVDKHSVMGGGIRLTNEHALPWRRAITQLTGCGNLSASSDWAPVRLKVFPRTLAEANAGKTITTRPVR